MDDASAPADAPVADAGPDTTGDTESEAYQQPDEGGEEPPPRQYVEIDDPDNRYERVKVAGEELEVPYSELVRGYSREADYTRKAQALAQQRQEAEFALNLQRALDANPEMTLRILAEQRGITLGQQGQQAPVDDEIEYSDPLERAIAEERQARLQLEQRLSQRESDEALDRAITGLRQQFNLNDDDVRQVVHAAYEGGYGIDALPMIYKTMAFDRLAARVQAQRDMQARQEAETNRRTTAKSQAGQVVSSRSVGANGITNQVDAGGNMTLREAIESAFTQVEGG